MLKSLMMLITYNNNIVVVLDTFFSLNCLIENRVLLGWLLKEKFEPLI